jgi:hypothetical protein
MQQRKGQAAAGSERKLKKIGAGHGESTSAKKGDAPPLAPIVLCLVLLLATYAYLSGGQPVAEATASAPKAAAAAAAVPPKAAVVSAPKAAAAAAAAGMDPKLAARVDRVMKKNQAVAAQVPPSEPPPLPPLPPPRPLARRCQHRHKRRPFS